MEAETENMSTFQKDNNIEVKMTGRVTLPAEAGHEKETLKLSLLWGADAIRDSDGTRLSNEILKMGYDVYSTVCLVRADQEWPKLHKEHIATKYLISTPKMAVASELVIQLLKDYSLQKYEVDRIYPAKSWWEVINRTTGEVVEKDCWEYNKTEDTVVIQNARPYNIYTVSFLVRQVWDSVSMYNHLTNKWNKDRVISIDPYYPEARQHLFEYFEKWLKEHVDTKVVRLTTLAYQFVLDSDSAGQDIYRDWLGYTDAINILALEEFAREKGYHLRPEDFVDAGYFNATYRVPNQRYIDWTNFVHKFVVEFGKELVDRIHSAGKKAAIFWGDHWIGVEPYSPHFQNIGIDINIGACEDGIALRRLADSPGPQMKEIRLYPYFFPDAFAVGNNPVEESINRWVRIRRAMLRKNVDRIGYGGYLNLILKFPDFVEHVTTICDEFRLLHERTKNTPPYTAPITVAILNAWGKLRSWLPATSPDQKFHVGRADVADISGSNVLECLSGLPFTVKFISFEDILRDGIGTDIDVILNEGVAGTAWSGGKHWANEKIVTAIRKWVYDGGAFIGITDPSAYEYGGRFFQLGDVLGVQKEIGHSSLRSSEKCAELSSHFILYGQPFEIDLQVEKSYIFASEKSTEVLKSKNGHILVGVNRFGSGRSVYLASLPYSHANSRLLARSIFWASQKEAEQNKWFSSNYNIDVSAYIETDSLVAVNNCGTSQATEVFDYLGNSINLILNPYEARWLSITSFESKPISVTKAMPQKA